MNIADFRVINYASFEDSGLHQLGPGVNVVAGQNNVGKTALLHALSLDSEPKPHRNSSQPVGSKPDGATRVQLGIALSSVEFEDLLRHKVGTNYISVPANYQYEPSDFIKSIISNGAITMRFEVTTEDGEPTETRITGVEIPGVMPTSLVTGSYPCTYDTTKGGVSISASVLGRSENITNFLYHHFRNRLYFFHASRSPKSSHQFGSSTKLHPDASNLAEVLGMLQSNTHAFARYVRDVRRVLPAIKWVSVRAAEVEAELELEILIWNIDPQSEREDLANPLRECGTGVGHVLAILYLIHKSSGDVIIIDEPNSFLHPGASRSLSEILRESRNHQFILSTHAPEVMSAARPDRFFKLQMVDERTVVHQATYTKMDDARQVLAEVGSKLSDVLGYDKIIWVEGPTEVQALPLILDHMKRTVPANVVFLGLRSTGDLESKQAAAFAEVYRNISAANTTIPEPLAILLDGDKAGDTKITALNTRFPGSIRFLDRRTLENYILMVPAITAFLNTLPTFLENSIEASRVEGWMLENGGDKKYAAAGTEVFSTSWLSSVDSTKLLPDLVQDLSEARETYKKPIHTVQIIQWFLDNNPAEIQDLSNIIVRLIPE